MRITLKGLRVRESGKGGGTASSVASLKLGANLSRHICVRVNVFGCVCFQWRSRALLSCPETFLFKRLIQTSLMVRSQSAPPETGCLPSALQFGVRAEKAGEKEASLPFLGCMWGRRKPAESERESKPSGK